ncbi:MAG: cupin domain-containing protein [Trueperaceae bacterium]|nr:cupin domain-containing protein [Trueperaceae bacterium]
MADVQLKDHGPSPYTVNIETATVENPNYRTALWTGTNLQLTLMSIPVGGEIGLEVHQEIDQFLRIEEGKGRVQMGDAEDDLDFDQEIGDDWVVLVPAGKWHNITNVGDEPLKIYSIYAPPEHPHGTVHATKAEGDAAEDH